MNRLLKYPDQLFRSFYTDKDQVQIVEGKYDEIYDNIYRLVNTKINPDIFINILFDMGDERYIAISDTSDNKSDFQIYNFRNYTVNNVIIPRDIEIMNELEHKQFLFSSLRRIFNAYLQYEPFYGGNPAYTTKLAYMAYVAYITKAIDKEENYIDFFNMARKFNIDTSLSTSLCDRINDVIDNNVDDGIMPCLLEYIYNRNNVDRKSPLIIYGHKLNGNDGTSEEMNHRFLDNLCKIREPLIINVVHESIKDVITILGDYYSHDTQHSLILIEYDHSRSDIDSMCNKIVDGSIKIDNNAMMTIKHKDTILNEFTLDQMEFVLNAGLQKDAIPDIDQEEE